MESVRRNPDYHVDDLSSEFDYQSEAERQQRKRKRDFTEKESFREPQPGRSKAKEVFHEEHGRLHRRMSRLMTLDAYSRHKEIINLYHLCYPGATALLKRDVSKDRTDYDVLKDNHKFVWSEDDELRAGDSWESRMAKKYYDKLFKEYCIVDLTFYQQNKVAMRWRTENEVKSGKGQFVCGNKKCTFDSELTSWEVNFAYQERGERKSILVKVRLCPECSAKLNYGSQKKKYVKKLRERRRRVDSDEEPQQKKEATVEKKTEQSDAIGDVATTSTSEDIWAQPAVVEAERTVDEDIDDFLNELFC